MAKFSVVFIESYLHKVVVEANSYEEAGERADRILSLDSTSYCPKEPDWFLHSIEREMGPKKSRKDALCAV